MTARSRLSLAGLQVQLGLWPLRVLWLAAPLAIGSGLADGLDHLDGSGGPLIAEIGLWAAWFAGLVATLVPSPMSLTAIRMLAPGSLAVVGLVGVATGDWPVAVIAAAGYAAITTYASFLPVVGDRMVNGSAYGSERRMALRPPAFVLLGPAQLAWLAVVVGAVTGPWLLAAGFYLLGGIGCVVGAGIAWLGARALHQLARRWLVFVPAGFVIHDHVLLVESILLRRSHVDRLGAATTPLPDGTIDLSGGASGLALEAVLAEPVTFGLRRQHRDATNTEADRLVFTPTLPGAVLAEARTRAIKIGSV